MRKNKYNNTGKGWYNIKTWDGPFKWDAKAKKLSRTLPGTEIKHDVLFQMGSTPSKHPDYLYFDSGLEVEYAQRLDKEKQAGTVIAWKREGRSFNFNEDKQGKLYKNNSTYTPDFEVYPNPDPLNKPYYVEVKGYPTGDSIVKIRRFLEHYPEIELRIYTSKGTMTARDWLERIKR